MLRSSIERKNIKIILQNPKGLTLTARGRRLSFLSQRNKFACQLFWGGGRGLTEDNIIQQGFVKRLLPLLGQQTAF